MNCLEKIAQPSLICTGKNWKCQFVCCSTYEINALARTEEGTNLSPRTAPIRPQWKKSPEKDELNGDQDDVLDGCPPCDLGINDNGEENSAENSEKLPSKNRIYNYFCCHKSVVYDD